MPKMIENASDVCAATSKTTGEPCKARPIKGGTVCRMHGGSLPNVKASAQFRIARDSAQRMALKRLKDRMGASSTQNTIEELERLAAEATVFKDVAREQVEELLAAGKGFGYEHKAGEQIRATVTVYERAMDRCNSVLATCVKLNIADRRQKLDEAEAMLVAGVIQQILRRLELTERQKVIAGQVVPEELRALSAAVKE